MQLRQKLKSLIGPLCSYCHTRL